eukprot:1159500-Pelagomonas_calceolata.AAC.1
MSQLVAAQSNMEASLNAYNTSNSTLVGIQRETGKRTLAQACPVCVWSLQQVQAQVLLYGHTLLQAGKKSFSRAHVRRLCVQESGPCSRHPHSQWNSALLFMRHTETSLPHLDLPPTLRPPLCSCVTLGCPSHTETFPCVHASHWDLPFIPFIAATTLHCIAGFV